ncbi:MAG: hypothetical protein ABW250_16375 [Pyrinomonadaceae bacterium]
MTIVDENDLIFEVEDGEAVTITAESENTVHRVTFDLDGSSGQFTPAGADSSRFRFVADQSQHEVRELTLVFHFTGQADGVYRVAVSGSRGGGPFEREFKQRRSKVRSRVFTFDVV